MTTSITSKPSPELQKNPLIAFGRGICSYSDVKPTDIAPAIDFLLQQAQYAVDHAVDPVTPANWDDLVEPLEDATESLSRSWGVISHLNSVALKIEYLSQESAPNRILHLFHPETLICYLGLDLNWAILEGFSYPKVVNLVFSAIVLPFCHHLL